MSLWWTLGAALSAKTIRSAEDVVSGVACAALALEYATPSKRLFPEAIGFLADVLAVATRGGNARATSSDDGATAVPPCTWVSTAEELTDRTSFSLADITSAASSKLRLAWMDAYQNRPITAEWW